MTHLVVGALTTTLGNRVDSVLTLEEHSQWEVAILGGQELEIDSFPRLKGVFKVGVGVENLNLDLLANRGISVRLPSDRSKKILFDEVAAFATRLALDAAHRLQGDLETWRKFERRSCAAMNVLVIGQGNIGSKITRNLKPMFAVSTFEIQTDSFDSLESKITAADIVILAIPGGGRNAEFLNHERISTLKPGAHVINVARGDLISEADIRFGIERGISFSLDVFPSEPYRGTLGNFFGESIFPSPHVAGYTSEYLDSLADDLLAFLAELGVQ